VLGGDGDDSIVGGLAADTLRGEDGDDLIDGDVGSDLAFGGDGDDSVFGSFGDDTIHGDDGNDTLTGSFGIDILDGGSGADLLMGGGGDDVVAFSLADGDSIDGGSGIDRMVFSDETADFDQAVPGQIAGVEILDLDAGGIAHEATLDAQDILDFGATTGASFAGNAIALVVRGDAADTVNLDADAGTPWTIQGSQAQDGAYGGATYDIYSNGSEWVAIEQGIVVNTG